jgi:hypothetical protein
VDRDLVVEEAQQDAGPDAGRAAVGLVPDMVNLARRGGLVAAAGPPAVPVAQDDGVADAGAVTVLTLGSPPPGISQLIPGRPFL